MTHGLDDFEEADVATRDGWVHIRTRGAGPPVLLLHGIPETGLMWHGVAPALAEDHAVVVADLRGFGQSGCPPSTDDHAPYSMRTIAAEQVEMMRSLGHERFAVAGHDRGARCAYRLALDHPQTVTHLAVLDVVPTSESFDRADADFALGYWIWSFLAAPPPLPERLLAEHSRLFVDHMLDSWSGDPSVFGADLRAEYAACLANPDVAHAVCEEYRAAATLDREHDAADLGRRRIACPTLVLWSAAGPTGTWYDPLEIWRDWADDVTGRSMDCGHFIPEEAPDETVAALRELLRRPPRGG